MIYDELALRAMAAEERADGPELLRRLRKAMFIIFPTKEESELMHILNQYITEEEALKYVKKMIKDGYKLRDLRDFLDSARCRAGIYKINEDGRLIEGNIKELQELREKYIEILKRKNND